MLLRHLPATDRRLRHQFLLPGQGRHLRQPVYSFARLLVAECGTPCTLTQQTSYPTANTTQLQLEMARPENFTIYVRVPAWADAKTRISVNGKRVEGDVVPGKFFALSRTWKNGDRVEYEMGMPLRLQAVDAENPQIVALRARTGCAVWQSGTCRRVFPVRNLLAASCSFSDSSEDCAGAKSMRGKVTFRPFRGDRKRTLPLVPEGGTLGFYLRTADRMDTAAQRACTGNRCDGPLR